MHIEKFKKWSDSVPSKKTLQWLYDRGLNPYVFTFLSFCFKIIAIILFAKGEIVWGGLFVFVEFLFDGIDGRMARALGLKTEYGLFADLTPDRIFRSAYIVAIAFGGGISWEWAAASVLLDIGYGTVSDVIRDTKLKAPSWGFDSFRVIPFAAPLNLVPLGMMVKFTVGTFILAANIVYIGVANRSIPLDVLRKKRKERRKQLP